MATAEVTNYTPRELLRMGPEELLVTRTMALEYHNQMQPDGLSDDVSW